MIINAIWLNSTLKHQTWALRSHRVIRWLWKICESSYLNPTEHQTAKWMKKFWKWCSSFFSKESLIMNTEAIFRLVMELPSLIICHPFVTHIKCHRSGWRSGLVRYFCSSTVFKRDFEVEGFRFHCKICNSNLLTVENAHFEKSVLLKRISLIIPTWSRGMAY